MIIWGFHKWEIPNSWMVYFMKNPKIKWIAGGTPMDWKPPDGLKMYDIVTKDENWWELVFFFTGSFFEVSNQTPQLELPWPLCRQMSCYTPPSSLACAETFPMSVDGQDSSAQNWMFCVSVSPRWRAHLAQDSFYIWTFAQLCDSA